jgi:glutamyl-tRNA(Gln) amidotransferase subunit E
MKFDPIANYESSKKQLGYVERKKATQADYDRIGFMSGLEVHQQLLTDKKLFCRCPAGIYQEPDDFDAEIIRHMRPTLSELGEYDGTALMEFKTRKNIIYRLKNKTACTYEIDDTPPFPINRDALEIAIKISLLSKLNIVGELHITRKQYLDGSIPTGFQRTAIVGVEGMIHLKNKDIRLIQLSIEEDSCREVSDIGHWRIYRTDRLGMPLIETVTYPDMTNPNEVKEACDYIRFLNRSTGLVRTGIGAGRQDVNVSCKGGTRVEIKGVAHTKWIPELTHNECFRQWALLQIKDILLHRVPSIDTWQITSKEYNAELFSHPFFSEILSINYKCIIVNLPNFEGILSHFTQPAQCFANEISDRLKVIACIEKPNMTTSESFEMLLSENELSQIRKELEAKDGDAQIIFWGLEDDIKTALETIEERCRMAFSGVPNETRKSFEDGTTIFERVLPGADRMYPDTDSPPIPLENEYIANLSEELPIEIIERFKQMKQWNIAETYYTYILQKNLFPLIKRIISELQINPRWIGNFIGQKLKRTEGIIERGSGFSYEQIFDMFAYLKQQEIDVAIAEIMLPQLYRYPRMDFDSILETIKFKKRTNEEVLEKIPYLIEQFEKYARTKTTKNMKNWVMGQAIPFALGNINLKELSNNIQKR